MQHLTKHENTRLHLYRGEWAAAAASANAVITATPTYALAANYAFYSGNTAEDIFTIEMSTTDNSRTRSGGLAGYHRPAPAGRGDAPFSTSLVNTFLQEPGDLRLNLSDSAAASDGPKRRFTLKYPDAKTNSDNAPVIRVTEMYLNEAEALAQLNGINQPSIDLINGLRKRAGLPDWTILTFSTPKDLINGILNERGKELVLKAIEEWIY